MKKSYKIIHEDDDIVVLDKAGHVLTIEDRFDPSKKNLRSMMINRFGEIYVVHRLDFETSGIIIFAKNENAHRELQSQFENRTVTKVYQAITRSPLEDSGIIEDRIAEKNSKKGTYQTSKEGKSAQTVYKVLEKFGPYSLLEIQLFTGRTHQIRVHLKSIGAPLLTDRKYGISDSFYLSQIKRIKLRKDEVERPLIQRTSLHAHQLTITHPSSKRSITFTSDLHKDMKAVLFQLSKSAQARSRTF